jgi:hypothetical protein
MIPAATSISAIFKIFFFFIDLDFGINVLVIFAISVAQKPET